MNLNISYRKADGTINSRSLDGEYATITFNPEAGAVKVKVFRKGAVRFPSEEHIFTNFTVMGVK